MGHRSMKMVVASLIIAGAMWSGAALSDPAEGCNPRQIAVSRSAEILIPATKATFSIGITTTGNTASSASEDNARLSAAVNSSLQAAHLDKADILGSSLVVQPRWDYSGDNRHPKRTGFEATKTIRIATERLTELGAYIDAALSAGATDVSEVQFSAKDTDSARRQALAQAVASAKADAETIAHAAGGTLGEPLMLSTERTAPVALQEVVMTANRARAPAATDITPSEIRITVQVDARWKLMLPSVGK